MADGEDRAVEVLQRALQHLAAVHVQVVGGLVHQQEVVVAQHQLRQRNPALLAAGQRADGLEHVVAGEQEQRKHPAHPVDLQPGEVVPDLV